MRTLSLKLPEDLEAGLNAETRRQRASKSTIVRLALESYLRREGAAPKGSFLDRAADLDGCLDGPADLSTAAEHLEGYGR